MNKYLAISIGCLILAIILTIFLTQGCTQVKEAINVAYSELKPETKEDWLFLAELVVKAVGDKDSRIDGIKIIGDRLQVDLENPTLQALDALELWQSVIKELTSKTRTPQDDNRVYEIINQFREWKQSQEKTP